MHSLMQTFRLPESRISSFAYTALRCHRAYWVAIVLLLSLALAWHPDSMATELKPLEQQQVRKKPERDRTQDRKPAIKKTIDAAKLHRQTNQGNKTPGKPARAAKPVQAPKLGTAARPSAAKQTGSARKPVLSSGEMLFNFQDADVKAVIKTISQITGKNFILDPRVKGKISIISAKPVSKAAAYRIFLSALKAQGFTAATVAGGVTKIIPVGEGKQNASISDSVRKYGGESMISQVVVVQHGTATQMVPLLRPLMAPTSQLSAYAPANALIITDYADNVRRLLSLIDEIDKPVSTDVTIIPLKYASALDMAELISRLLTAQSSGRPVPGGKGAGVVGSRASIVPDLRTNSLLVRSENPGRVAQLRKLVAKLDVPAKTDGNTRVIYLKNADATELAKILRGLLNAEARGTGARTAAVAKKGGGARGTTATTSLIQADEATNSLIISASDAVYNNLRGVIEKLDVRRAQVFVEALIVEIQQDKGAQLGFQWAGAQSVGEGDVGAVTNFTVGTSLGSAIADPLSLAGAAGLTLAFLGPEITLADGSIINGLGGLARALETRNLANILSTPNLLTLDNAEAKIVVGQNVPFLTGSFAQATGTTGTVNPFQTIERKDVGLTLEIKPQITEGGSIKLEIASEVSNVVRTATLAAQDLITNKRSLNTTVVVEDGHTIVLGGLIEESADESSQAVPWLGRIPLLGWLFKYREQNKRKTNLMIFLRPTIVRNPEDSLSFTADRYDYIIGQQDKKDIVGDHENLIQRFSPANNATRAKKSEPKANSTPSPIEKENEELLGPPNSPTGDDLGGD